MGGRPKLGRQHDSAQAQDKKGSISMIGRYTIEAKAYDKTYGMVGVKKCFIGTKQEAYEEAMQYAYAKAQKFAKAGVDFSVTITGEGWRTASKINPNV